MKKIIYRNHESQPGVIIAFLDEDPSVKGFGTSGSEAVGNLIEMHPDQFGNITENQIEHDA